MSPRARRFTETTWLRPGDPWSSCGPSSESYSVTNMVLPVQSTGPPGSQMPSPESVGKDRVPGKAANVPRKTPKKSTAAHQVVEAPASPTEGGVATTAREYQLTSYDSEDDGLGDLVTQSGLSSFPSL